MDRRKIYDCVTFFDENVLTNLRFELLKNVVDFFVVCESKFDHKNRPKKQNFKLLNQNLKNKVRYMLLENPFPETLNFWQIEEYQREKLLNSLKDTKEEDYIMYSDSDEIPDPEVLKNLKLKKKFGIFLQNFHVYNLETINDYETPWEGTRICKKKHLKSITYLRKKIKSSNLRFAFRNIFKTKSIEFFENGGWHFNNFYSPEKISIKLKTFQHTEFAEDKYSNPDIIKNKIKNYEDLFNRGHKYRKVNTSEKVGIEIYNLYNKLKDIDKNEV